MNTSATSKRCWPTGAPACSSCTCTSVPRSSAHGCKTASTTPRSTGFDPADLKERGKWDEYTRAYEAALGATSTDDAPWYVIPADHKWYRNRVISQLLLDTLSDMNPQFPEPEVDLTNVAVGAI